MLRLTLGLMRRSTGRLIAAGLAVLIGTAFVTSTLLASAALKRASYDVVTAPYAESDLVVGFDAFANGRSLMSDDLTKVAAVPGVRDATAHALRRLTLDNGDRQSTVTAIPASATPSLQTYRIDQGRLPRTASEIALSQGTLDKLGLTVGDVVSAVDSGSDSAGDADAGTTASDPAASSTFQWTVVGVASDPTQAWAATGTIAVVSLDGLTRASGTHATSPVVSFDYLLLALEPGSDPQQVAAAVSKALGGSVAVISRDAVAAQVISSAADGENILTAFILGFAGIALLVAALVIANTFQVLVAQRTRTLALLRCAGASRRQLRTSVLTEATLLGLGASLAGLLSGTALTQGVLMVLRRTMPAMRIPAAVDLTLASVIAPLLVGTLVTVAASLVPAREATRVAPLAALQPLTTAPLRSRGGRVRAGTSIAMVCLGALLLAVSLTVGRRSVVESLLTGMAGGTLSFVGFILGAVFWMPPVARGFAAAVARLHPTARLAAANVTRNPRRTVATSTALLIGVTLVSMMSVGAASARASLDNELDSHYAVDLHVVPMGTGPDTAANRAARRDRLTQTVRSVDGIAQFAEANTAIGLLSSDSGSQAEDLDVVGISPADAVRVLRDPGELPSLTSGILMVNAQAATWSGLHSGDLTRFGADASLGRAGIPLTVRIADVPEDYGYVTPDAFAALSGASGLLDTEIFAALAPGASALRTSTALSTALDDAGLAYNVLAPAADREQYGQVIDTILAVIIGLLAVAVVIALIGVANTLSLSVLERRRESATLRAIGLRRRQLRSMLAVEGMFISGIGTVLGIILGLAYGWLGSLVVLGAVGHRELLVPWANLAIILLVGLAAGLLASILPARSAARTPPVAALAVE